MYVKSKYVFLATLAFLFTQVFAFADNHADDGAASEESSEVSEIIYDGNLKTDDFVGISFWLATAMMLAATVFFFIERDRVKGKWKTSLSVAGLVTSIVMLVGGYLGETGQMEVMPAFIIGMAGWVYIIWEIFKGEASQINEASGNAASQQAFKTIRAIVTFGWAIYPLGYYMSYMGANAGSTDADTLNIIYNIADLVNKAAFGLALMISSASAAIVKLLVKFANCQI